MHRVIRTIRAIADEDLPTLRDLESGEQRAATEQDLLNMDIVRLAPGIYSCQEQERRDEETLEWLPHDLLKPGDVLSEGEVAVRRYAALKPAVRAKVMRATVIRSESISMKELVATNLSEQRAAIEKSVGLVDGAMPFVPDVDAPIEDVIAAELEEARRLMLAPANDIARVSVPMEEIARDTDVIEAEDEIPHAWAGERFLPHR